MHIWPVAHLADVGAVKGRRHIGQSDGGVPFQNITWPIHVTLETTLLGRIRHLVEVEDLEYKQTIRLSGEILNRNLTKSKMEDVSRIPKYVKHSNPL